MIKQPQWQGRKPDRSAAYWQTVAVTGLPAGWRNRYQDDETIVESDCPALLMQELRIVTACWDNPPHGVHTEDIHQVAPYEVRVAFADAEDGTLNAAKEISNYVDTLGPGDLEDIDAGRRSLR